MDSQITLALAAALDDFITHVQATLYDHALTQNRDHLEKIATDVSKLNDCSLAVLKSRDTEIEDVGAIVQDILNQPITNSSSQMTTMLKSCSNLDADLPHVMRSYIKYSHATERLIQELTLLSDELKQHAA